MTESETVSKVCIALILRECAKLPEPISCADLERLAMLTLQGHAFSGCVLVMSSHLDGLLSGRPKVKDAKKAKRLHT